VIINLCFDTYENARLAHRTLADTCMGWDRIIWAHGKERIDFQNGVYSLPCKRPSAAWGPLRMRGGYGMKFGKLPNDNQFIDMEVLRSYQTFNLIAPEALYREHDVSAYGMDGNDQVGDCTTAAAAHLIQLWNAETRNYSWSIPSQAQIVREYFALTGGPDSGLVVADVLKHWATTGLFGHKILGYAPIPVSDTPSIRDSVYYYGGAYVGVQLPSDAEDQFNSGRPWTVTGATGSLGGHCVPVIGYDRDYLYVVTWGRMQSASWDWWGRYGDEAWAVLAPQMSGGFRHLDLARLRADLALV
jgi:hypothetical protein